MKIGVCLPQFVNEPATTIDAARQIEELGFDSVSLFDHLQPLGGPPDRPILECFTMLTAVAASTQRVGLRSLVARATLRPPATLAAMARSLDRLSDGRFVLGIGGGDAMSDHEDVSIGLRPVTMDERHALVRTCVDAVRAVAPDLPIWLGGTSAAIRRLAADVGAAWNVWAATPAEVRSGIAEFPGLTATWAGPVLLAESTEEVSDKHAAWASGKSGRDVERAITGDPETVSGALSDLADAGVTEAILSFVGGEVANQRRLFAAEVGLY